MMMGGTTSAAFTALFVVLLYSGVSTNALTNPMETRLELESLIATSTATAHTAERGRSPIRFRIPLISYSKDYPPVAKIEVGKKAYEVMFDTQSSDMFLFHKGIKKVTEGGNYKKLSPPSKKKRKFYPRKWDKGSKFENGAKVYTLQYPDGSSYSGGIVHDKVHIGAHAVIGRMYFGVMTQMNEVAMKHMGRNYDGIVGLGSAGFISDKTSTTSLLDLFTYTFYRSETQRLFKLRQNPVFSFYISATGASGELMFGGHDKDLCEEPMEYFPALLLPNTEQATGTVRSGAPLLNSTADPTPEEAYEIDAATKDIVWGVRFDNLMIDKTAMKTTSAGFYGLLSTTIPYGIAFTSKGRLDELKAYIGNEAEVVTEEGGLVIACEKLASNNLPDISLTIGGSKFSFSPQEYFLPAAAEVTNNKKKKKNETLREEQGPQLCHSFFGVVKGINDVSFGRGHEGDVIRLGIPFMKKYYCEYDYGCSTSRNRAYGQKAVIGFARSKGIESTTSNPRKGKKGISGLLPGWGGRGGRVSSL